MGAVTGPSPVGCGAYCGFEEDSAAHHGPGEAHQFGCVLASVKLTGDFPGIVPYNE